VEAILEEAAEQSFVLGESDHTVADVAGRKDAILAAQATGAATIIGNSDDGRETVDRLKIAGRFIAAAGQKFFEAAKKGGESSAAAESDDVEAAREWFRLGGGFLHGAPGTCSFYRERIKRTDFSGERANDALWSFDDSLL
jgi:general stress protein YciG